MHLVAHIQAHFSCHDDENDSTRHHNDVLVDHAHREKGPHNSRTVRFLHISNRNRCKPRLAVRFGRYSASQSTIEQVESNIADRGTHAVSRGGGRHYRKLHNSCCNPAGKTPLLPNATCGVRARLVAGWQIYCQVRARGLHLLPVFASSTRRWAARLFFC